MSLKSEFIDEMSIKEKKDCLKRKINEADEELLDDMLLDFGFEYSDDFEED